MTTVQTSDDMDQSAPDEEEKDGKSEIEEPKAPKDERKAKAAASKTNGNGHRPTATLTEEETALALAESVEGQFETVRTNALDALGTLKKQREKLDASIESLETIVDRYAGSAAKPGVAKSRTAPTRNASAAKPTLPRASSKRHRRSAAEIKTAVDSVVTLVKKHKDGIGAQKIRETLAIEKKDMAGILKAAMAAKALRSKGHKRATCYFAAK